MIRQHHHGSRPQRGIALITSLLILVIVALLAVSMYRSFGLQEKIAGNTLEKQRSLQAAESALQYGEWWIVKSSGSGSGGGGAGSACSGVFSANDQTAMKICPFGNLMSPATVRALIQEQGDTLSTTQEYYRWWSNPVSYTLADGTITLTTPLTPDQWSSVLGKFGNTDATSLAGFQNALANVGNVGMTFGGGCFFGHGVNVAGGTAQFKLLNYVIN